MSSQLALDIRPPARRTDPETSRLSAADLVATHQLNQQCGTVLHALRRYPHRTSAELARDAGLDRHMTARRLSDLREAGYAQECRHLDGSPLKVPCRVTRKRALTWEAT